MTISPSICCCAAHDASALHLAGYTAAAGGCTGKREEDFQKRGNSIQLFCLYVYYTICASLWPAHIAAGPEAGPHVHHSLFVASTR